MDAHQHETMTASGRRLVLGDR